MPPGCWHSEEAHLDGIRRYAGIDWAKERHAVCVVDRQGRALARFEVEHTEAGLRELVRALAGVEGVAIERPDGPVVETLLGADLPVVVIASRHVKALRASVRARKDLVRHRTALSSGGPYARPDGPDKADHRSS